MAGPHGDNLASVFRNGQLVRVRVDNPAGHTRAPAYVRGRTGIVESVRGMATLPDSAVHAAGEPRREQVYAVRFEMAALWGADAEPGSELVVELWESYLEAPAPAPEGAAAGGSVH